ITQNNGTGSDFAAVFQVVKQSTRQGDPQDEQARQSSTIDQTAVSGANLAVLSETSNQFEQSDGGATQTEFSDQDVSDAGHHISQTSTGVSQAFAAQSQLQRAVGSGSQMLTVDPKCCSVQGSNPNDVFNIAQFVSQTGNSNAVLDATAICHCLTSGNCTYNETTTQNGVTSTNCC